MIFSSDGGLLFIVRKALPEACQRGVPCDLPAITCLALGVICVGRPLQGRVTMVLNVLHL